MALLATILAIILSVTALQTLAFYLVWYFDRRNDPAGAEVPGEGNDISVLPALAAIVAEWLAISVLALTYPLRLLHDASPVRTRVHGKNPIIFVHGYGGNSANMAWMQWMLKRRGYANVYAVSYTPPTIDARKLAKQVSTHVERILAATGAPQATVICHSMGGPLTRYALQHLGLAGKLEKVICLGSPHLGTRLSAMFEARGAAFQMRYRSDFLAELADTAQTPGGARFYSIYSNFDNFLMPANTAILGGNATNIHVPYHGHCALLYSPVVLDKVEQCLAEPVAAAEQAA